MKPNAANRKNRKPQQVRIIGGIWKRTPLPVADVDGLRPTPDRVRETVFNWIAHLIGGDWSRVAVLDLFSGTGAFGFEAASRGAAQATLVESNPAALRQLDASKEKLRADQVAVVRGDAQVIAQRMATGGGQFDLIFVDPPYQQNYLERVLPSCAALVKDGGIIYAESPVPLDRYKPEEVPEWLAGWEIIRSDRAGMVHYYLLQRAKIAGI